MATIDQILDFQIHFKYSMDTLKEVEEPVPIIFVSSKKPLTLRAVFPLLKEELETSEKPISKPFSDDEEEKDKGGRPPLFTEKQKSEIAYKYTHYNTSKSSLAREYHCSEKTIRNVLKSVLKGV